MSSKPPSRLVIPGADSVPIVGERTRFVVCKNGHCLEAPNHPVVRYGDGKGGMLEAVLCGRCQFDFFGMMFGGVLLGEGTTEKEAKWAARDMRRAACDEAGVACCPLGVNHAGNCQELGEEKTS